MYRVKDIDYTAGSNRKTVQTLTRGEILQSERLKKILDATEPKIANDYYAVSVQVDTWVTKIERISAPAICIYSSETDCPEASYSTPFIMDGYSMFRDWCKLHGLNTDDYTWDWQEW